MVCPYCGAEMVNGSLIADGRNGADLYWMPKGQDVAFLRTREKVEKKGGILFGMPGSAPRMESYRCAACKKLIVSYE